MLTRFKATRLNAALMNANKRLVLIFLIAFIGIVFWLDLLTNALAPFTPFYLILVALSAFYLEVRVAFLVGVVCSVFGTIIFYRLLPEFDSVLIAFRFLSNLFIYSVVIYLIGKVGKWAINSAEDMTQLALDGASLGLWEWDLASNEVKWSEQYFRIFGYASETEVSYDRFFASVHPEDREKVKAALQHSLESGLDYFTEFRVCWANGSERWILGRGRPFLGSNGKPERMAGIVMDITDRKQAEIALLSSAEEIKITKQLLKSIIDSSPSLIFATDLQQRFTMANAAFLKFMGLNKEAVYGRDIRELQPPEIGQKLAAVDQHILDSGESDTREEQIFSNEKSRLLTFYTNKFPKHDSNGNITGLGGVATDITEIKEAQFKLEERNRQIEILNQVLEERAVQAEAANRAKGFFIDNLSHEFRTPMNAVLGYSELLIRDLTDPKKKEMAESIKRSGRALMTILSNILDFSELSKHELLLNNSDFCLGEVLQVINSDFREAAESKGLVLKFTIQPDVPTNLHGDPKRLTQVLNGFIDNAVKFTDSGTISIGLSVADLCQDCCTLRFEIADTGIGIATEKLNDLFDPFTQGDASNTRAYGGTGIGLSLNLSLVILMGGEVGVESQPGQGSKFWFTALFSLSSKACPPINNLLLNGTGSMPLDADSGQADQLINQLNEELLNENSSATNTWKSLKVHIAINQIDPKVIALFEARLEEADYMEAFEILIKDILPQAGRE